MKKWHIHQADENIAKKIAQGSDLSYLCAQVLSARGIRDMQSASDFFQCEKLEDPFRMADMQDAVDCLNQAIADGTRICIYGDYDCDGVTSTVMLYSYLFEMGANVTYRIPEREEGYGLNPNAVQEMKDAGVELIVTVDNGITAIREAELIQSLGMRLLVTDHHQPLSELPEAEAVVDPHRLDETAAFRNLCGAGVVLKLIIAMEGGDDTIAMEQYGDLAAIATVADVVELAGENRWIVQQGLRLLANTERPGLLALMEKSGILGKPFSSTTIAFSLAPRINASGRFGSPLTAVKLLLCEDPEEAAELAEELDRRNQARKEEEAEILQQIAAQVQEHPELLQQRVLVFAGENWHHGVIGIAASRLQERFGKPTILVTIEEGTARGSMRSFGAFSAFRCLQACESVLLRYGGHPGAGGFSLPSDQVETFQEMVQSYARESFPVMPEFTLEADKLLLPEELTLENIASLSVLAPFGEGNSVPVFAVCHAVLQQLLPLSNGIHTKLRVTYGTMTMDLLLFRTKPEEVHLQPGDACDFLITAEVTSYQGNNRISAIVKDYRKSGTPQAKYLAAKNTYAQFCRQEPLRPAFYPAITPVREELIQIYQRIPLTGIAIDTLFFQLQAMPQMNYCKLRLALDVFSELGLIQQDVWLEQIVRLPVKSHVDLQSSKLLQGIQQKGAMLR